MKVFDIYDIGWVELIVSYGMLAIPVLLFGYFKTGLIKSTLIAAVRMGVQLFLVGLYLEYIFALDSVWVNMLWVIIMIVVASFSINKSSELKNKYFVLPVFVGILLSLVIVDTFFLGYTVKMDHLFEVRYFIPITGMILGNSLQTNIISMNEFYHSIKRNETTYRYALATGATFREATAPFMRNALKKSFNPMIARMAVIGLIALPGTMTGQIIGGSSPVIAIKYQIMIMLAIFVATIIAVFLAIIISNRFVFDKYLNLRLECLVASSKKKKKG